jgi:hypothetical protein
MNLMGSLVCVSLVVVGSGVSLAQPKPVVEVEEDVFTYTDSQNGSFPLWTYGSTILARVGDALFLSAAETIPEAPPLNNVRWVLMKRTAAGWGCQQKDAVGRTREPCPIAVFRDGRRLWRHPAARRHRGGRPNHIRPAHHSLRTHQARTLKLPVYIPGSDRPCAEKR